MHVQVSWAAELLVLEVMMFHIGDEVTHIVFAGDKRFLPQHFAITVNSRGAMHIFGQVADQQLRPIRTVA